jgi:cation transport regulator ChaC
MGLESIFYSTNLIFYQILKLLIFILQDDAPDTPAITGVLVYIGSPNRLKNQYYLGPAPLWDMASQIATARGPAGTNYEYLFRLEEALYEIGKCSYNSAQVL